MTARLSRFTACLCLVSIVLARPGRSPAAELGYPRPFSFREVTPKNLDYLDWMTMVVSDLHLRTRQGADVEFKRRHPGRPVLVQINAEGLGLWGTWICLPRQRLEDVGLWSPQAREVFEELGEQVYPVIDFPGYWVYEAGSDTTGPIPAGEPVITVSVGDVAPFRPSSHPHSTGRLGRPSFAKDVVICPRKADGELDWLRAEFASVASIDPAAGAVTLRRWKTHEGTWRAHPAGSYVAPNANQIVMPPFPPAWRKYLHLRDEPYVTPFLPNLTRFCPRDPRTGLNAAEWLARHFVALKKKRYPTLDGYVFDVSAGTFHPSSRISPRSDCNLDGKPDGFYFHDLDHWALGMHDFFTHLRWGVKGKFEGLGAGAVLVSDANMNEESRFFDLLNGAEYEFGMVNPWRPKTHTFSSNLDRYLLWCTRSRLPRTSYLHHKYPTDTYHGGRAEDLAFYMHDNYFRLDVAAACLGTGYVGSQVGRPQGHPAVAYPLRKKQIEAYGTPLPLDWDEYHAGRQQTRFWLGMPRGEPVRVTSRLTKRVFGRVGDMASAVIEADPPYRARRLDSERPGSVAVEVEHVEPWRQTGFKIRLAFAVEGLEEGREYALRFEARAPSPYAKIDRRYATIPRNLEARLTAGGTAGLAQEALVFAEPRAIVLTLTAPASGDGRLEFGLGEEPGDVTLSAIELFQGCADLMARRFEHGLVLLNGSATTPFAFDLGELAPGESYQRIDGAQDPEHNSGQAVGRFLTLGPRDGILLERRGNP